MSEVTLYTWGVAQPEDTKVVFHVCDGGLHPVEDFLPHAN